MGKSLFKETALFFISFLLILNAYPGIRVATPYVPFKSTQPSKFPLPSHAVKPQFIDLTRLSGVSNCN